MADPNTVPLVRLSNGGGRLYVPIIGLGTWQAEKGEVGKAVQEAIAAGYRNIDCAFVYQNEEEVGEGIAAEIKDGTVKREDLFITTKLWNTFHSRTQVKRGCQESLTKLGLDYVDLFLIHSPMGFEEGTPVFPKNPDGTWRFSDVDYVETWSGMEGLLDAGLAKSIGVSNFNIQQITRVLDKCKIKPAMLQVECHVYLQQDKLFELCKKHGIAFTAYSPLGGTPPANGAVASGTRPMDDPVVLELAKKKGKTPSQILLKFLVMRGMIAIPKSTNPERLRQNIEIFDFELEAEEMKALTQLDRGQRIVTLGTTKDHKYYPFSAEF